MTTTAAKRRAAALVTGAVVAAVAWAADEPATETGALAHEQLTFRDQTFHVVRVDLAGAELRMFWQNPEGDNYLNFGRLRQHMAEQGKALRFACNAGIYTPEIAPAGLHVEHGEKLHDLNTRDGQGNFHLMPNGVFYVDDDGARVVTTEAYAEHKPEPILATQSGPMLVIDGAIHPKFNEGSKNRRVRSGVGVVDASTVVFAISAAPVNFYDFAALFRDELKCNNALYLDGDISAFYAPQFGLDFEGGFYAGILAVVNDNPEPETKDTQ